MGTFILKQNERMLQGLPIGRIFNLENKRTQTLSIVSKTSTYIVTTSDYTVNCSGTFTITLPSSIGITGQIFNIKNSGNGLITVATVLSQTIDSSTTINLNQWDCLTTQSDGNNWIII